MHRARSAAPAALLLLALAACSGGDAAAGGDAPAQDAAPAGSSLVAPASAADLAAAGLLPDSELGEDTSAEHGVVPGTETATDRYGEYTRVSLAPDAPVLTLDPAGPWGELLDWLDPAYVQQALTTGATFFVEEWVDAPTRWDDSAEAWARLNTATGELMQQVGQDVRAWVADGDGADRIFDLDDVREGLGVRPVEYAPGQARFVVDDLSVTNMGVYAPFADSGDTETIGLSVTYEISTRELVTTADGGVATLRAWLSLTLGSFESTGAVVQLWWDGSFQVERELDGGTAALPVLETPTGVPAGWEHASVGGLTFAVPTGGSTQDDGDGWLGYTLDTTVADGSDAMLWVLEPRDVSEAAVGTWYVLEGFTNYGLQVPGATAAAAEIGSDVWGQYRARVFINGTIDGKPVAYRIEWDTTPERAQEELVTMVGAMSVDAS